MMKKIFFSIIFLSLVGFGCSPQVSETEVKITTEAVNLQAGSAIILKQTVFGLGGVFAETVSGDNLAEYQLAISSFTPSQGTAFSWTGTTKQETAASVAAREAFAAVDHPIGDTTKAPEAAYETLTKTGVYTTSALAEATKVSLPAYWIDGEQNFSDSSLIWLSKKQYDELVNTKVTTLSLGLLDTKLSDLVGMTDSIKNAINALQQKADQASAGQDVYKLTAENNWKNYSLSIDGVEKTVQAIGASNWFGSYLILANPNNPLVLKATLNPFALGSLDLSSPLSSFLGYEVTEIKTK
ncbi:MAG: hypothetical protein V1664_04240 [Candidatus Uhrbacteria bacterium]